MGISHTQEEGRDWPMKSQQEYFSFPPVPSSVLSLAPFLFLTFFFRQTHSVAN